MDELSIDPGLQSLIPPLKADELKLLTEDIVANGCRDALVIWQGKATILDGHNRYAICREHGLEFRTVTVSLPDIASAKLWIIRNQLGRRNLTWDQWKYFLAKVYEVAKKSVGKPAGTILGQNEPISTAEQVAKEYGVSAATVKRAAAQAKEMDKDPELKQAVLHDHKRFRAAKAEKAKKKREAKRKQAAKGAPKADDRIVVGDFREKADKVADGSLSLIFTDPPYNRKAADLLDGLGAFAAAKLAPGGSLLCYVGQTQLPAALDAFRQHLRYWWTVACLHSGRTNMLSEYGVRIGWKAVLWFVKDRRHDETIIVSDVMSGGEEKTSHEWQQAESEAAYWIEKLCEPDGIVCDPFLGSGTTGAAAIKLKRSWIGFEIDPQTAASARKRVNGDKAV